MMMHQMETYGLLGDCVFIRNTSICEAKALKKLSEDSCVPRVLKGGNANCTFNYSNEEIVELINDNTPFLTNYTGILTNNDHGQT